jgi:hypothetical protein
VSERTRTEQDQLELRAIFEEEIAEAERNHEPSDFIEWLEGLRDRVLQAVRK